MPIPTNIPNIPARTPSPTITPSPTATDTPVPTFTSTPLPKGIVIEEQEDGSTLIVDYDRGYQLLLPVQWFVVPVGAGDLQKWVNAAAEVNPALADTAEAFETRDPEVFRVIALHQDPKFITNGYASNISVTAFEDSVLSGMPVAFQTGAFESSFEQAGAKVLTQGANLISSDTGLEIGIIDIEQVTPTATGAQVTAASRILIFTAKPYVILITLAAPKELSQELFPALESISASVELLK